MAPRQSARRSGSNSTPSTRRSPVSNTPSGPVSISSGVSSSTSSDSQPSQRSSSKTPSLQNSPSPSRSPPRESRSPNPTPSPSLPSNSHPIQNLPPSLFDASARVGTGHGRPYFELEYQYNHLGDEESFIENRNLQLSEEDSGADSEIAEDEAFRGSRYDNGNEWLEYGMGRALGNVDTDISEEEDLGIEGLEVGESAEEDQERRVDAEVITFGRDGEWRKVKRKEMALSLRDFVVPDSASDSELERVFGGSRGRERISLGRKTAARKRRRVVESNNERRNWKNVYVVLDSDDKLPRKRRETPLEPSPPDLCSSGPSSSDGYQGDIERSDTASSSSSNSPSRSPPRSPPADPPSSSNRSDSDDEDDENADYQMFRIRDAIDYTAETLADDGHVDLTTRVRIPYGQSDILTLLHHAAEAGLARSVLRHAHYEAYDIELRPFEEREDDDLMVRIQDAIDYTAETLENGRLIEVTTQVRILYGRTDILSILRDAAEAGHTQFVMANDEYEAYDIGLRPCANSNTNGYSWNIQSNEPRGVGEEEKKFGPPSEWPTKYPESDDGSEASGSNESDDSQSSTPIGIQRAREERAAQQVVLEEEMELVDQQRIGSDDANYIGKDPLWWLDRQTGKPKSMANVIIGPDDNDQTDRRHEDYKALQQEAKDELKEMREQRKIAMKLRQVKVDSRAEQDEEEEQEEDKEGEGLSDQEEEMESDRETVNGDEPEDEPDETHLDTEDEEYEEVDDDHSSAGSYAD